MKPSPWQLSLPSLTVHSALLKPCAKRSSAASALFFLLSITAASAQSPTTAAANEPAGEDTVKLDTFVVSEVRNSLINAQEIKENAKGFVDSIVAQDIGKLPDNTVGDALQRVAGVQVARSAGEAINPVIRGLPNIETTINGYEVFTGTGRGVAVQDIPAEMLAELDVYKTVSPEQVEGGVAGLIDIRLHRPFDFKEGLTTSGNIRGMYSSQADKYSYFLSGLVNDRWKSSLGDFGVLIDVSYQQRRYEDQIWDNYVHFAAPFDVAYDASGKGGYYADNFGFQEIPGNRKRSAVDLALQWRTPSGIELYSDTLFTGYRNKHQVNFFIGIPSWGGNRSNVVLYPAGTDGVSIPDPLSINGADSDALFVHSFTATGTNNLSSMQSFDDMTNTIQGAFGGKWNNDRVSIDAEFSYNISLVKTKGVILDTGVPSSAQVLNIKYNEGGATSVQASGVDYNDPSIYYLDQYFDQWGRSFTDQWAVKSDATIQLGNSFLKSLKFGVRYSDRNVNFHSTNNGIATGNPAGFFVTPVSALPGVGRVSTNNLFISSSDLNVRSWWSADPNWLLTNTDQLRTLFGQPAGNPKSDPAQTFFDTEKDFALHGLVNYGGKFGDIDIDGLAGVRLINTRQDLGGYQAVIDPATGASIPGDFERTNNSNSQWDLLPTLNGKAKLVDNLFLRYGVSKTVTRPNFADLNPALSLTSASSTIAGTGSGGNPKLDPIKSTNYDLSLEYYLNKSSQVTVTGFYRTLNGYIQTYGSNEVINGNTYFVTHPQNTGNGYLRGAEFTYQQFFDFLPDWFKGLGVQANYTYIDGKTDDPLDPGTKVQITQVAKSNYNLILIYEKGPFSSRLAYTWRGKYIDSYNQPGIQPTTVWVDPTKQLDLSISYNVTKNVAVTFDATNLLRSKYHDHFGPTQLFSRDVRSYDSTYAVGVRFRY
jgi:TonB-dependent receptor